MKLTARQERFVKEYLVDLNATQAALRAGYSEKTAYSQGQRLLKHVEIQAAVQTEMEKRSKRVEITQDRVLLEYARLAFFDPRKLFDEEGAPKHITDLDEATAAALAGLDVVKEVDPDCGGVTYTKKYKLANKLGALESLGKHLGLFDGGGGNVQADNNLFEAIERAGKGDLNIDGLPELQHTPGADPDMVEPS